MLTQPLKVIAADEYNQLTVKPMQQQHCSQCGEHGCGIALMGKLFASKAFSLPAPKNISVQQGDTLMISLPENVLLKISLCFYLLPLVGLLLGAVGFSFVPVTTAWYGDGLVLAGAVLGFLVSWYGARYLSRQLMQTADYQLQLSAEASDKKS